MSKETDNQKEPISDLKKALTLGRFHYTINTIYNEWDEGDITIEEAYARLEKDCKL